MNLNLKKMLSNFKDPKFLFKTIFSITIAILIIDAIYFVKNVKANNVGMYIFNLILFIGIGYHSLLMLVAILKEEYQKNVLVLIGIDLCSMNAYVLCPIYIIIAFINSYLDFILPMGCLALLCHFFIIPSLRKLIE